MIRTIIYVDGFNLYYGSLRKTPYKWLDLKALFTTLLNKQNEIVEIKYFTARISPQYKGDNSNDRQKIYLKALEAHINNISIYYGHYLSHIVNVKVHNPPPASPPYLDIIKTEEKGSDVNLSLHILNDAWLDRYDCAVLVSNDGDIAEALRFVKEDHNKKIGLFIPGKDRKISKELQKYATFIKRIRPNDLLSSQLPNPIQNTQLFKPKEW